MTRREAKRIIKKTFSEDYNEKDLILDEKTYFGFWEVLVADHNISFDIYLEDNRIRKNILGSEETDKSWNDVTIIDWEDRNIISEE